MSLTVSGKYEFDGPYQNINSIKNQSGVYIVTSKDENEEHDVHDIGESESLQDRLNDHDRTDCWERKANGSTLYYSAYYCNEQQRVAIESELRDNFSNLCGAE